ncbi:hypothetical protein [Kitasatospora sp. KL5]|uniref:hypothetical protein n=1 Tax=Kitasatospora sp. KL5 TaxID=3425125 RepID=UPI003D6F5D1C
MPAALPRPRPVGSLPTGAGRCWSWVATLLAVLALMLSHGLEGESPTGHLSTGVHAVAVAGHHEDGHDEHAHTQTCDALTWTQAAAPVPVDDDHHSHSGHVCLAGGPTQAPSLPGLWPAPTVAAVLPAPAAPAVESAHRTAGGEQDRLAGIQVLRV